MIEMITLHTGSFISSRGRRRRFIPIRLHVFISRIRLCLVMTHYTELITTLAPALLASGAPNAFFATSVTTPSKGLHIRRTCVEGGVLGTFGVRSDTIIYLGIVVLPVCEHLSFSSFHALYVYIHTFHEK